MKLFFLKIFLLTLVGLASGCLGDDVDIENNRRLLVKGKVVDHEGNAVPGIKIITSGHDDQLAETRSDASGNFEMVSLDEAFDPLNIHVNPAVDFGYYPENPLYTSVLFYSQAHNQRLLYDLGTVVLGEAATFTLNINNIPGDENSLNYELRFTTGFCQIPLENPNPSDGCELNGSFMDFLNPDSENMTIAHESILGSTMIFEYSLNSGEMQTIEIPINNPNTTYVFEF